VPRFGILVRHLIPHPEVRSIFLGLLLVILAAAAAPVIVRWILPVVLRVAVDILTDLILVVAGLILLPDFWVSVNCRSSGRCPPKLVYEFGSLVAAVASHSQRFARRVCLGFIRTAEMAHPGIIAVIAGTLTAALLIANNIG
jgi:hypothetical protein